MKNSYVRFRSKHASFLGFYTIYHNYNIIRRRVFISGLRDRLVETIRAREMSEKEVVCLIPSRGRFRGRAFIPVACRSNKRPQVSQHFAFSRALYGPHFACERVVRKTEEYTAKKGWARARREGRRKGLERSQPFGGWRRRGGREEGGYERRDGPGSYGIIYLTGRETKRTKHCRGVASQTEPLGEKERERERAMLGRGVGDRNREN